MQADERSTAKWLPGRDRPSGGRSEDMEGLDVGGGCVFLQGMDEFGKFCNE